MKVSAKQMSNFLSKKDIIPSPSQEMRERLLGETLFLRAFFFHEIIKRYGGMPILNDKLLYPNDNLSLPRNSYMECVNAILEDLKQAIGLLPVTVNENEQGRITRGVAMALKARVLYMQQARCGIKKIRIRKNGSLLMKRLQMY